MDNSSIKTIGFVGLGAMGLPMAINLVKAGFIVKGKSRNDSRNSSFIAAGGVPCENTKEIFSDVDAIITMVPDGNVVLQLVNDYQELLKPGMLFVDMSTIAPQHACSVGALLHEKKVDFLDAPVSGGVTGAKEGTLSIMVGGSPETVKQAEVLFAVLGQSAVHMGDIGAGQVAKAANQLIVGGTLALVSEAVVLLEKNGVDTSIALDALKKGLAGSRILESKGSMMANRNFPPAFTIALHSKDMQIVQSVGRDSQCALPVSALVAQLFTAARAFGLDQEDHSSLIRVIETLSGKN